MHRARARSSTSMVSARSTLIFGPPISAGSVALPAEGPAQDGPAVTFSVARPESRCNRGDPMSSYTISGRIVGTDGAPIRAATVVAYEIVDLTSTPASKGTATTDRDGRYTISWVESSAPLPARDLFVRAERD